MRLVRGDGDSIECQGRRAARAPLVVGTIFVAVPAMIPLLSPGPITPSRLCASAALFAIGAALLALSWPRRRRTVLDPREKTVRVDHGRASPLANGPFRLVATTPSGLTGSARYGVAVPIDGGRDVVLLSGADPATVLRDLGTVRDRVPSPVLAGWGLPASGTPWTSRDEVSGDLESLQVTRSGEDVPLRHETMDDPKRRRISATLLVGAAGVATLLASQTSAGVARGDPVGIVSVALPCLAIFLLVMVGIGIGTASDRLSVDGNLTSERRVFGVTWSRRVVARASIRHAYLVSPIEGAPRHVLLDTTEGPVALPCEVAAGLAAVERLRA